MKISKIFVNFTKTFTKFSKILSEVFDFKSENPALEPQKRGSLR